MLNHIVIMGRLAKDPELRHTQSGIPVAALRLAVDRDFKDKQTGERLTDWIDVVAWRSTAEFVTRYFSKGRMAVVDGRLQMRDWTDKDGNRRTSAEVVADNIYFGDSRRDGDGTGVYNAGGYGGAPAGGNYGAPSGNSYSAPSGGGYNTGSDYSAPVGGYNAPPSGGYRTPSAGGFDISAGEDQYAALSEDDGDLPF